MGNSREMPPRPASSMTRSDDKRGRGRIIDPADELLTSSGLGAMTLDAVATLDPHGLSEADGLLHHTPSRHDTSAVSKKTQPSGRQSPVGRSGPEHQHHWRPA